MVLANGLDSFKEMIYGSGIQDALANRGISSIAIDQPGTGEALRLNGLTALIEAEVWAGAVIDYLEQQNDVDSGNIGMCAWSLGGTTHLGLSRWKSVSSFVWRGARTLTGGIAKAPSGT